MADIQRAVKMTVWLILGFLAAMQAGMAFAEGSFPAPGGTVAADQTPMTVEGRYKVSAQSTYYSSADSACAARGSGWYAGIHSDGMLWCYNSGGSRMEQVFWYSPSISGWTGWTAVTTTPMTTESFFYQSNPTPYHCPNSTDVVAAGTQCSTGPACPANSTGPTNGQCTCNSGFDVSGSSCVARACLAAGDSSFAGRLYGGTGFPAPSELCISGCGFQRVSSWAVPGANARWEAVIGPATGATCSGSGGSSTVASAITSNVTTEGQCLARGQGFATINGVTTCAPPNAAQPLTTVTSSQLRNGSSVTSDQTVTTTDNGATVSRSVSTTSGGTTTVATTEQARQTFCEENPRSSVCQASSVSGGASCGAAPSCDGDAATCAIVMQAYETRCAVDKLSETSSISDLGNQILNGADPLASSLPSATNATSIAVPAISQNAFLSGSALADESFVVMGSEVVIPWSRLNSVLSAMGMVMVALAMLGAVRIVGVT